MKDIEIKEFECIYLENAIILTKYLKKIGCPPQDVEDIVQETFIQALLHIHQFKGESKISVWLCKIAKNTWLNQIKKNKKTIEIENIELIQGVDDDHLLEQSLSYISEPFQHVFMLRAIKGLEFSEIAQIYHKSESWARVTYHRAKIKYRELFKEEEK